MKAEDELFARGNAQGITFVAASGDSGALAAVPVACFDYLPKCGAAVASVSFPASRLYSNTASGYNRVLGNETVNAKQFMLAPMMPSAGTPQTPSNA